MSVLCTHMHVDHVGWNTRLENGRWVPTFPRARYVFSAAEFAHWNAENAKAAVPPFADSVLPVVEAGRADMVADDHVIADDIRLEATPATRRTTLRCAWGAATPRRCSPAT